MPSKTCNHCNTPKPLKEFTKDSKCKNGYSCRCLECTRKDSIRYYNANKKRYRAQQKKHREENLEYYQKKEKQWRVSYYIQNKDRILKKRRKRYAWNNFDFKMKKIASLGSPYKICKRCKDKISKKLFRKMKDIKNPDKRYYNPYCRSCEGTIEKERRKKEGDRIRARQRELYWDNRQSRLKEMAEQRKKMPDWYIALLIRRYNSLTYEDIKQQPEMIKAYRENIKLHREINNQNQ